MDKNELLAWASGVIDSRGCLAIYYYKWRHRVDIICKVRIKHYETVNRLYYIFGGSMAELQSDFYQWNLPSSKIVETIKLITPYLYVKKKQAKLILEFAKVYRTKSLPIPRNQIEIRKSYGLKSSSLNMKDSNENNKGEINDNPEQTPEMLAWAAGIIDGSGYIIIDSKGLPKIEICMKFTDAIYRLQAILKSGIIYTKNNSNTVCLWIGNLQAFVVNNLISKYLYVKKLESQLLSEYEKVYQKSNYKKSGVSIEQKEIRKHYHERFRNLK